MKDNRDMKIHVVHVWVTTFQSDQEVITSLLRF